MQSFIFLHGNRVDFLPQALLFSLLLFQILLQLLNLSLEVRDGRLLTLEFRLELADLMRVLVNDELFATYAFKHLAHLGLVGDPLLVTLQLF